MLGNGGRADKANRANLRMIAERIDHIFAAIDEIDDAFGQARFFKKFERTDHAERDALGRLQYKRVSAGDSVRQEPVGNHRGKIEWNDGGDDAERLANLHFVDAWSDVFQVVALHHHGNAAGDLDIFDASAQFCFRFAKGLAVFKSDQAREFVEMLFKQILQLEEILHALPRGSSA